MNVKRFSTFVCTWGLVVGAADLTSIVEPIIVRARQLAFEHMQDRSQGIPIISIAGCSAVGKSYFTHVLFTILKNYGVNVCVLHQDDYLNIDRTFAGFKIHPNLDHHSLDRFLEHAYRGEKNILKPCIVDKKKHVNYKMFDFSRVDIILFEGIYALTGTSTYDFFKYANFGIFLDADTQNIVRWHASRNKNRPFFTRVGNSDLNQHASCLLYEYVRFILPSKLNASYVIYKDDLNSYRLMS